MSSYDLLARHARVVLKNAGVMHLTYYVNRLTTTKVDSTYLAVNQQCITYNIMCCGRARTLDHLIGSQAPYPIAEPSQTTSSSMCCY